MSLLQADADKLAMFFVQGEYVPNGNNSQGLSGVWGADTALMTYSYSSPYREPRLYPCWYALLAVSEAKRSQLHSFLLLVLSTLQELNTPTTFPYANMDQLGPLAAARIFLPKLPSFIKSAVYHSLWLSPTSTKWDLRTELTITFIRSLMSGSKPTPILKQQRFTLEDPGIKGAMWISKVTLPAPSEAEDILNLLTSTIDALKQDDSEKYTTPSIVPVEAEWTGYRSNVPPNHPRPDLSEAQHYEKLMSEVSSDLTILYLHGGALFLCDPSTHRPTTSKLANLTGGRCLSLRYRLSPQVAFPAALLDVLIAYISLLYPPPNALHAPIPASKIIVSGDSAGGNLSLALLQLLLQINRTYSQSPSSTQLKFHNHIIYLPLPVPGGIALASPWCDLTRSLPSISSNSQYDYLPPPLTTTAIARFPTDKVWPTDPPRGDIYCETSMMCHPLVSPLAASDWHGACPVWFGVGEEMLADEAAVVASRIAKQGGKVRWGMFGTMPHCFAIVLDPWGLKATRMFYENWAGFCGSVVAGEEIETRGTYFEARSCGERGVIVEELNPLAEEEVLRRMRAKQDERREGLEGEAKLIPRL